MNAQNRTVEQIQRQARFLLDMFLEGRFIPGLRVVFLDEGWLRNAYCLIRLPVLNFDSHPKAWMASDQRVPSRAKGFTVKWPANPEQAGDDQGGISRF